MVSFEDDEGEVFLSLGDESGDESNQDHEFLYVLVNTSDSALGYQLSYVPTSSEGPPPPGASAASASSSTSTVRLDPTKERLRDVRAGRGPVAAQSAAARILGFRRGRVSPGVRVRSSTAETDGSSWSARPCGRSATR